MAVAAGGAAELGAGGGAGPAGATLWGSEIVCLAVLPELLSALGTDARRRESTFPAVPVATSPPGCLATFPPEEEGFLEGWAELLPLCIPVHRCASCWA